jgi:hypothetical protein
MPNTDADSKKDDIVDFQEAVRVCRQAVVSATTLTGQRPLRIVLAAPGYDALVAMQEARGLTPGRGVASVLVGGIPVSIGHDMHWNEIVACEMPGPRRLYFQPTDGGLEVSRNVLIVTDDNRERILRDAIGVSIDSLVAEVEEAVKAGAEAGALRPPVSYSADCDVQFGLPEDLAACSKLENRLKRRLWETYGDHLAIKLWVVQDQVHCEVDSRIPDEGWIRTAYTLIDPAHGADAYPRVEKRLFDTLSAPLEVIG